MSQRPQVRIYADESCLGNQFQNRANPGGAGGVMEYWNGREWRRKDFWLSDPDTTNNRMALLSAIHGLRSLRGPSRIRFISDSQYLVKGITEWLPRWKANGWKRKGGRIENLGLWKELDREAERHEVEWEWVRGHAGHPQNEYAHHLAVKAAKEQRPLQPPVESGFEEWLEREREQHQRYMDFFEFQPPDDEGG